MQYRKFLLYSGIGLLAAALLGVFGLGPTANSSILGHYIYFDYNQTIIHTLAGLAALAAYFLNNETVSRYLTAALGIVAISIAAYSFYQVNAPTPNVYVSNIEVPLESLVYLAFGLWALWVVLMPPGPLFVKDES